MNVLPQILEAILDLATKIEEDLPENWERFDHETRVDILLHLYSDGGTAETLDGQRAILSEVVKEVERRRTVQAEIDRFEGPI